MVNLRKLFINICESIYELLNWKTQAIPIINNNSERGTRVYNTVTSIARVSNYTDVTSIDLGPGVWYIFGRIYFPSNTAGYRGIAIGPNSATANRASYNCKAVQTAATRLTVGKTVALSEANTTIYLVAYCSTSNITTFTNAGLYALKLGPYTDNLQLEA